jgi:hypothetical protein
MRKRDSYIDPDDDEVCDGVRVRLDLMDADPVQRAIALDARNHRPGFRRGSLDERTLVSDARDAMIKRAENAWRLDARRKKNRDDDDDDDEPEGSEGQYNEQDPKNIGQSALSVKVDARRVADARAAANDSYRRMCSRLESAWRMQDAPQPDNSSSPAEWRRHMASVPDPGDPKVRRDKAYQDYTTNLSNAWMQGRTDPSRATEIETERERYLGKFA